MHFTINFDYLSISLIMEQWKNKIFMWNRILDSAILESILE
jgi:hypothetical protein